MKWYISYMGLIGGRQQMFGGDIITIDSDEMHLTEELIDDIIKNVKVRLCLTDCVILNAFRLKA